MNVAPNGLFAARLSCPLASLLLALFTSVAVAQDEDPFKSTAGRPEAADTTGFGAAGGSDVRIPVPTRGGVTFGPLGCPVVVVDGKVYSIKDGRLITELNIDHEADRVTVLSDDGKWFAYGRQSRSQANTPITIYSTETGREVFEVPGQNLRYNDFAMFSLNKYLLVGGRRSTDIQVWDFQNGKMIKSIPVPGNSFWQIEPGNITFTSDGKYYATVANDMLGVLKTATGKVAVIMEPPGDMDASGKPVMNNTSTIRPRTPKVRQSPTRSLTDSRFVLNDIKAMRFSPDNTELAAVSSRPVPRLICWDNRGKIIMDGALDLPSNSFFSDHTIQWLPDNSGWLVSGHLYQRESQRIVFGFRSDFASEVNICVLDKNRLFGSYRLGSLMEAYEIPWTEINASLKALAENAPAHLAPGQSVSLHMQLTGISGDQAETMRMITEAFTKRLARDDIKIASGQKTIFRVRLSEKAGDTLPIYQRQSVFDFRGTDTGRTVTERKGMLVMELIVDGQKEPIWRDTINASSARSFTEDINDTTVRQSMMSSLSYSIGNLHIPYFIPKSPDLYALPIVVE